MSNPIIIASLHIGIHYGGFYDYRSSVYPHSVVIRFIAGS